MKPPRSDRPRGGSAGAKPPHKPSRPHGPGMAAGGGGRSPAPDRGKTRSGTGDTGRPRFGSGPASPRPPAQAAPGRSEFSRVRPEREDARPLRGERGPRPPTQVQERPQAPEQERTRARVQDRAQVQDRARGSLTRERDSGYVPPAAGRSSGQAAPPAPAAPPRGTVWLYGLHAVQAALQNPARRLRRLVVTEEGSAALTARLPQPWALAPETVDRARIDQLLGRDAVHQGAALLADLLPQPVLAHALERPGPVLVLDQVTDPRNIGAILRSAAAFGVAAVIVQERHAPEETGSLAKAASGALETMPLLRAVNLARTIVMLKAANFWVVGLDAEAAAPLDGAAFRERRVALVLGGEGSGLRRLTRESCDELAKLPMAGIMESLNVSAATAVALYELGRAR